MKHVVLYCAGFLAVGAILGVSSYAYAQVPSSAEPGAIGRQLEETKPQPAIETKPFSPVTLPQVSAPEGADKVRFVLKDILFDGATVFTTEDFAPIFQSAIGQEISLADVYGFAGSITQLYQQKGYLFSYATVNPQKIVEGIAIISIVEGTIEDVTFEGIENPRQSFLEEWRKMIVGEAPSQLKTLERVLLLINRMAGIQAEFIYKPVDVGRGTLNVAMKEKTIETRITINNRGTRYIGPFQQAGYVFINNTMGGFEKIVLGEVTSIPRNRELRNTSLEAVVPLSAAGDDVAVSIEKTYTQPGFSIESLDVKSHSLKALLRYTHPLILTRRETWNVFTTFDVYNSQTDIVYLLNSEDRVRSLRLGSSYGGFDHFDGYYVLQGEISQGLDILDSTKTGHTSLSRTDGRSDYTKLALDYQRLQNIIPRLDLMFHTSGQYALSQLLSSEEFGYGGATFGRAYESSEITGDHGVASALELQYSPELSQDVTGWLDRFQLYGFYDIGAVWKRDSNQANDKRTGASAGLGFRSEVFGFILLDLEMALPLTRTVQNDNTPDNDPRFFVSLGMNF